MKDANKKYQFDSDFKTFNSKVIKTFVNGRLVYDNGKFNEGIKGKRLLFTYPK